MPRSSPPSRAPLVPPSLVQRRKAPKPNLVGRPLWLLLIASLWIATVCNLPLWRELVRLPEMQHARGIWFGVAFALVIGASTAMLLSLFAWRWTLKPAITLFFLSAAMGAHFMLSYGVVIDATMMVNALQTDLRETRDLLNWQMLGTVLLFGLLPAAWIWRQPLQTTTFGRQLLRNMLTFVLGLLLAVAALFAVFQDFSSTMRNHTQLRYLVNPLNSFYALGRIAAKPFERDTSTILQIGQDAHLDAQANGSAKPPLLLLVVGETGRSGNFAINGYARPTTPGLAAQHIASFRNAWSCGTNTAASVPCMFSHLGKTGYEDRKANYEGLLDVLAHSGMGVLWLDNQSGCKGVCDRIPNASTTQLTLPGLCVDGECFDEAMLQDLDTRIASLPAERRAKGVVVVLHQMGSHGPAYSKRSPAAFKKFMPECTSNALQECTQQELTNAYDNTIAYTDHFLTSAIGWLKGHERDATPAMIYVADHGESLGENNIYLHGMPYNIAPDFQKHVPWITWLSPGFEQRNRLSTTCLQQRQDERLSHDNYFHSVLGLLGVRTALYQPALDLFRPCTER